ncbi:hypothetical protein T01_15269 [Trichinella spiralis]|uniref:Uncharacterized protein n=1 Tax=Trichinella spiralis TaxID=6334 RepID=A0A0V1BE43_TRISP|nr:hypothetical protein T01_15269 [Trichinella spiralis]
MTFVSIIKAMVSACIVNIGALLLHIFITTLAMGTDTAECTWSDTAPTRSVRCRVCIVSKQCINHSSHRDVKPKNKAFFCFYDARYHTMQLKRLASVDPRPVTDVYDELESIVPTT